MPPSDTESNFSTHGRRSVHRKNLATWFGSPYDRAHRFNEDRMQPYSGRQPRFCTRRFFSMLLENERGQTFITTTIIAFLVLILAVIFVSFYSKPKNKLDLISSDSIQIARNEELTLQFKSLKESMKTHVSEQLRIDHQLYQLQLRELYNNLLQEFRVSCNQHSDHQRDVLVKWQKAEREFEEHLSKLSVREEEYSKRMDLIIKEFYSAASAVKETQSTYKSLNGSTPTITKFNFASAQYGSYFDPVRSSATLRPNVYNSILSRFMKVETGNHPLIEREEPLRSGECWCFSGHSGVFAVHLAAPVFIEKFEYIHTQWEQAGTPPLSAPRIMQLWGCESTNEASCTFMAECVYALNLSDHKLTCYVDQLKNLKPVALVELRVTGNHGHDYTCLYSFKVYGTRYLIPPKTV